MILIGCEESQTICGAFRRAGYESYSCDLQPTRGNPEWHYQEDICEIIPSRKWSLIVLHPDCTAMSLSGNRWYGKKMPRHSERMSAIMWTVQLWEMAKRFSDRVALENPASVIFQYLKDRKGKPAPVQYIQPYQFGHGEKKKTGLALIGLPPLKPTRLVTGREERIFRMPPGPNRKRDRSKTYDGVAEAIAQQWGERINQVEEIINAKD